MVIIRITTTTKYPSYEVREEYVKTQEEADKRADEIAEELVADKTIKDWIIETI